MCIRDSIYIGNFGTILANKCTKMAVVKGLYLGHVLRNKCTENKNQFLHKDDQAKIKENNFPLIVCRSKSGGAHAFLFTKEFVPATVMRVKLKLIASAVGFSGAEIFPKQDYIRVDRGDTGRFLNLPYHASQRTVRFQTRCDCWISKFAQ